MVPDPENTPRSQVGECTTIDARICRQTIPLNSPLPLTISWSISWVRYHGWWMTRSLPGVNTYFSWFLEWLNQAGTGVYVCIGSTLLCLTRSEQIWSEMLRSAQIPTSSAQIWSESEQFWAELVGIWSDLSRSEHFWSESILNLV